MYHRTQRKHAVMRLTGRAFDPPGKPDILKKKLTKVDDRIKAGQAGTGTARGHEHVDEDGVLYHAKVIRAQAMQAIKDTYRGFHPPKENADKVIQDAREQQEDATRELAKRDQEIAEVDEKIAALGERHGPGPITYGLMLLTVFLLNLPIDTGAAQLLPIAPAMQLMLAILIGAGTTWCAHFAGKKIIELKAAWDLRHEDAFTYRTEQIALGFALGVPVLVIIGTTRWRGQAFKEAAQATDGLAQGGAANIAFAFLALLGFTVAVLGALAFQRLKPLRDLRNDRGRIEDERRYWQNEHDKAERMEEQGILTRGYLDAQEREREAEIEAWADEREGRVGHHKIRKEMKVTRKDQRNARPEAPEPPEVPIGPAPDPQTAPPRPMPTRLVPLDLEQIAAEVEAVANANHAGQNGA